MDDVEVHPLAGREKVELRLRGDLNQVLGLIPRTSPSLGSASDCIDGSTGGI